MDVVADLGVRRVPVEIKAGETVAADAFKNLDFYPSLSGDRAGVLVYAGSQHYETRKRILRPWWACT